jgi:hypothetical protein
LGGRRGYRQAIYGLDLKGEPIRNLVRHKREYGDPKDQVNYGVLGRPDGTDPASIATDSDYEMRRARTPVPTILRDAMERHLAAIYSQEVKREADAQITKWWEDVDGRETSVDDWMADTVSPLLMLFGGLDILFDHPRADDPDAIKTKADQLAQGLDACIACVVLPTNMVWWKLDPFGQYVEAVVAEVQEDGQEFLRHWTDEGSTLYDRSGRVMQPLLPHPYGRVPILRLYDRKRPRSNNVGFPRYEPLAELQREYYNRDSELILSDTLQAHPILQGPEDYVQPDGTIPVGPGYLIPEKKYQASGGGYAYAGFSYVDPPKGAAESIRQNKTDIIDQADRSSLLTKPAGAKGTTGHSVGQSGVSKRLDANEANKLLSRIAKVLGQGRDVDRRLRPHGAHRRPGRPRRPRRHQGLVPDQLRPGRARRPGHARRRVPGDPLLRRQRPGDRGRDPQEARPDDPDGPGRRRVRRDRQGTGGLLPGGRQAAAAVGRERPDDPRRQGRERGEPADADRQPAQVPVAQPAKPAQPPVAKTPKPSAA